MHRALAAVSPAAAVAFAAVLVSGGAAQAGLLDSAVVTGEISAIASMQGSADPLEDGGATPFLAQSVNLTLGAAVELSDVSFAQADASINGMVAGDVASFFGSVGTDVDDDDGLAVTGVATASVSLMMTFVLAEDEAAIWSFEGGFAGGTHADASVELWQGATRLFSSYEDDDFDWTNNSGLIGPGEYTLMASAFSSSDLAFFNGLFGGANFDFSFRLDVPSPAGAAVLACGGLATLRRRRA